MRRIILSFFIVIIIFSGCKKSEPSSNCNKDTNDEIYFWESQRNDSDVFIQDESVFETTHDVSHENIVSNHSQMEQANDIIPEDGQLVRIVDYIPNAVINLKYATVNNFTGSIIYDDKEAYLCYGTIKKLINVQDELDELGYCILIWDAYRSPEAQWKLWETYPDPMFVANPNNGITSHSLGNTIDISLVWKDGSSVEMPSEFDDFSAIADRDYSDVSETAAANSKLLEDIMYRNGFTGYYGEWWDYSDTEQYELKAFSNEFD